jgi:hypothetical protein
MVVDGSSSYVVLQQTWNPLYLRIDKIADSYTTSASPNAIDWTVVATWSRDMSPDSALTVGIWTASYPGYDENPADFDYFRVTALPLIPSPASFNYSLLDVATDSTQLLSLFNPSGAAIPIPSITLATPAFSVDSTGLNGQIAAHTTFELPVTFAPTTTGSFDDTLTIVALQPGDSVIRIPLHGEAEILLPPVDSLVVKRGPLNGTLLYWAPVTHTISGQPFTPPYYIIYGSTTPEGPFQPFGVAPTTSYQHPFIISAQQKYFYQVTAASE